MGRIISLTRSSRVLPAPRETLFLLCGSFLSAVSRVAGASAEAAEKLKINSRVRAMVDSALGKSGTIAADKIRLASVPTEEANYRSFAVAVGGHTVRLMVIQPLGIWREYVSVEVDGEQAYLCVVESGEDLWPWIYRGIGLWEHLLDQTEYLVARKRERREIDSRFGNLKEEK